MKTLAQYLREYPEAEKYRDQLSYDLGGPWKLASIDGERFICAGLLQFTEDTADCWGGPFPGGYAAYRLVDDSATYLHDSDVLMTTRNDLWFVQHPHAIVDLPTTALPVELHVFGTDDSSWSKFYPTVEVALEELQIFQVAQPLDFHEFIDFGFVFTN